MYIHGRIKKKEEKKCLYRTTTPRISVVDTMIMTGLVGENDYA